MFLGKWGKKEETINQRVYGIYQEINRLEESIVLLKEQLSSIQDACPHEQRFEVERPDGTGYITCQECMADLLRLY